MKDPGKNIRKAFYDAISGLGYTVVDELNDNESLSQYIILSTQTEDDVSNKYAFQSDGTLLIDIVTKATNTVTKDTVDDMADTVLNALKPAIGTKLTDSLGEFQIINLRRISSNTLTLPTSTGFIVRKLLRFSFLVREL